MAIASPRHAPLKVLNGGLSDAIITGGPPRDSLLAATDADIDDEAPEGAEFEPETTYLDDGSIEITIGQDDDEDDKPVADDKFDRNLAEDMDEGALNSIGAHLLDGIEADISGRAEWLRTADLAAKYLGLVLEEPTAAPTADATIVKTIATCLLKAQIKLWAVARAELLPVSGPVKIRRDDPPPPNNKEVIEATQATGIAAQPPDHDDSDDDDLAMALETDLNHYLTKVDKQYYPDFSKMLWHRNLIGNAFRKVFRDPLKRRPVSVWVKAQDLIVSNDCTHLQGAGRVTEQIRTRQAIMRRLQIMGHYRDVPLMMPTGETTSTERAVEEIDGIAASPSLPEDAEHMVYECYSEVGTAAGVTMIADLSKLDRDEAGRKPGYPLPYRVSIDRDSRKVLEIRRDWKKGDREHQSKTHYVKYGFIPGMGFYDNGLIHLVGNPTLAATMLQRSNIDNALLANFPGGVMMKGPGSRQTETVIRPAPGQFIPVDSAGAQSIKDVLMPMPYKEPSAAAMALGKSLEQDVQDIAGVINIPVGEGRIGNTPVGTMMAYIEAVSQVPGAVHKDDHVTQQEEFDLLLDLFREDPSALSRYSKKPARKWQTADELTDQELVPAADPNTPSIVHRLMKIQALVSIGGMPQFAGIANNREIYRHAVRILASENPGEFEMPEQQAAPPPPDPRVVAAGIKAQSEATKAQAGIQQAKLKGEERMAELSAEGQQRTEDRQSQERRAGMSLAVAQTKSDADTGHKILGHVHDAVQGDADRAHKAAQEAIDRTHEAVQKNADRVHEARQNQAAALTAPLSGSDEP